MEADELNGGRFQRIGILPALRDRDVTPSEG